jgi:hypothetical protein
VSEETKNDAGSGAVCPVGRVTWWGFGRRWYGTATGKIHDEGLGKYAVVDPDEPAAWGTRLVLLSHVHPVGGHGPLMDGSLDAIEQAAREDLAVRPIDFVKRACEVFEQRADESLRLTSEVRYLQGRVRELLDQSAAMRAQIGGAS